MANDKDLLGGVLSIALSLAFFYFSRRVRYATRLAMRTPLTPAGQAQEGMIQVAGRAVGTASEKSYLLGLNCLITHTKIEVYYKNQKKRRWQTEFEQTKSVPFFVEDASGRIYVDPEKAEFELDPDLELTAGSRWRPTDKQRRALTELKWTADGLENRLRDLLFAIKLSKHGPQDMPDWMKRAAVAGHRKLRSALEDPAFREQARAEGFAEPATEEAREKLENDYKALFEAARNVRKQKARITEQNLLPGDAVYVLGPAFSEPPGGNWAYPIMLRKEHPADTFLVGEGTPAEVHARIRKKAMQQVLIGLLFLAGGIILLYNYYSQAAVH